MSGKGAPGAQAVRGDGRHVAIVAARWHAEITDELVAGAVAAARECGVAEDEIEVVRVPGAFEIPVVADALARSRRTDAIVCLGVVVRGGTPHFEYVCRAVTDGCTRIAVDHGVPVGFGVLTVDDTAQARERAGGTEGHKGREAMLAVLETAAVLDRVRGGVRGHQQAGSPAGPRR